MKLGDLGEEAMTPPDDLAGRARACAHWITNESSSHQEISDALIAFAQAERQRVWEEAATYFDNWSRSERTLLARSEVAGTLELARNYCMKQATGKG